MLENNIVNSVYIESFFSSYSRFHDLNQSHYFHYHLIIFSSNFFSSQLKEKAAYYGYYYLLMKLMKLIFY